MLIWTESDRRPEFPPEKIKFGFGVVSRGFSFDGWMWFVQLPATDLCRKLEMKGLDCFCD
ncbi:hypothetical protein Hanom_Chr17g01564871 [Helianthus anomalus]